MSSRHVLRGLGSLLLLLAVSPGSMASASPQPPERIIYLGEAHDPKGDVVERQAALFLANGDGSNPRALARSAQLAGIAWSSRGVVAYTRTGGIDQLEVDGGRPAALTRGDDSDPAWSPDGRMVAFSRADAAGRKDIYTMSADGTSLRRLTYGGGTQPAWSSRDEIAFVRASGENLDVYITDSEGLALHRVTAAATSDTEPSWSFDGRRLVFTRGWQGRQQDLYIFDLAVHTLTRLTMAGGQGPHWSATNNLIAFHRRGALEYISPNGGSVRPIRTLVGACIDFAWET
ncbi:MAG: hypothetical protein JWP14_2509 [Frankiales bacterium]|nr:hypothetical protein [Frankiales bacterium]